MTDLLKKIRIGSRCIVTGRRDPDPHHIKSRGAGGPDEEWNLMPLSREMHMSIHTVGLRRFAEKHASVRQWLLTHGWTFDAVLLRWVHEKETVGTSPGSTPTP